MTPPRNMGSPARLHFLLGLLAGLTTLTHPALAQEEESPNADCLLCHDDRELSKTTPDGQELPLFVDAQLLSQSAHSTHSCTDCHADVSAEHPDDNLTPTTVDCSACHEDQSASYGTSVHGHAKENGNHTAATCADCHGNHGVLPASSPDSPMHRSHMLDACGRCHESEASQVSASVHGKALLNGNREAPTCTDCHSEHSIVDLRQESRIEVARSVCSRCHASERLNAKYRMPEDRVRTFLGSYHGLAAQLGSTRAANCASCHGVHLILPSSNPNSSIHPNNLVATCGQCHPGATENFALGKVHLDLQSGSSDTGTLVNRWVRRIYLFLILATTAVCLLHNGLIWLRKAVAARKAATSTTLRMNRNHRWQHGTLAISFILLAISGFALKFPGSWTAWILGADETIRRWTHRGAAIAMIALALYHIAHLALSRTGQTLLLDLLPNRNDLKDAWNNLRFAFGLSPKPPPSSSRFNYAEKFEYWAVVWGVAIMGLTGTVIWFPVATTQILPRWIIDVATTIHYYEAILACLAILLWHFYHVIFDPDVYPLNWAFWNGQSPHPTKDSQKIHPPY